jgi:hypothetical protein
MRGVACVAQKHRTRRTKPPDIQICRAEVRVNATSLRLLLGLGIGALSSHVRGQKREKLSSQRHHVGFTEAASAQFAIYALSKYRN